MSFRTKYEEESHESSTEFHKISHKFILSEVERLKNAHFEMTSRFKFNRRMSFRMRNEEESHEISTKSYEISHKFILSEVERLKNAHFEMTFVYFFSFSKTNSIPNSLLETCAFNCLFSSQYLIFLGKSCVGFSATKEESVCEVN